MRNTVAVGGEPLSNVRRGRAAAGAGDRVSAAASCALRTIRRSPAVTATPSTRLPKPRQGIAGSRRSGRSLSRNAIVARVARFGGGAPVSLREARAHRISGTSASQQATVPAVCSIPPLHVGRACPVPGSRCPSRSDRLTPPNPGAAGCRPTRERSRPSSGTRPLPDPDGPAVEHPLAICPGSGRADRVRSRGLCVRDWESGARRTDRAGCCFMA